jgi:hypothetical protein
VTGEAQYRCYDVVGVLPPASHPRLELRRIFDFVAVLFVFWFVNCGTALPTGREVSTVELSTNTDAVVFVKVGEVEHAIGPGQFFEEHLLLGLVHGFELLAGEGGSSFSGTYFWSLHAGEVMVMVVGFVCFWKKKKEGAKE